MGVCLVPSIKGPTCFFGMPVAMSLIASMAEALHRLGIEYPIRDHAQAWDRVRSKAAAALTTIRSALEGTL